MYTNKIQEIDFLSREIDGYRPLTENEARQLREYFKIGLTYTSNAIEGNSLTETETKVVIEDGLTVGGKPLKEHFEAVGHSEAYDFMFTLVGDKNITEQDVLNLHRLFYYRIDREKAGVYRKEQVFITGTDFIPPAASKVPDLMKEFIEDIKLQEKEYHPVEYAARLHAKLVTIHPFVDGNGRTARLLMNAALLQHGYVVTIIPPVVRSDYICALREIQEAKKDIAPFVNFISAMVYESQKDYLRLLRALREE